MSGVEFKPCGETNSSEPNILLPLGKSVVGRGPLLAIADKRVSRNHGIMEVEDGKIKIMPTHMNPTFHQASGTDKLTALDKDVWKVLDHGDRIGLTPDQHIFEVIIQDRPINTSTQSLNTSIVESSPEKIAIKPAKSDNKAKAESDKKAEEQQNGDDKNADEDRSTEGEEQKDEKGEEEKETKEDSKDGEDTNGVGDESLDSASPIKEKVETVKLEDGKEVALPVQKERTLPDWMDKPEGRKNPEKKTDTTTNPDTPKRRGRPKKEGTPVKQSTQSPKSSPEEETPQKKGRGKPKGPSNKSKSRGRPRKRAADDISEGEEREEASPPASKDLNKDKRKKYSEDYAEEEIEEEKMEEEEETKVVYKDDDDWMLSDDEVESDISDWESSQKTTKGKAKPKAKKSHKKKGGRGRPPKIARTPSRRPPARGKKTTKSYFTDSEDDYFSHDDEVYVPKPTKRTAGKVASSQSQQSVESGEAEGDDDRPVKAVPKAKKRGKPSKKVAKTKKKKSCEYGSECYSGEKEDGEKEDGEEEGDKDKEECPHGAECYKKNPSHFKEFCHPGDPGYKSAHSSEGEKEEGEKEDGEKEDGEEEGDKDKEECPHGAECYKTNKAHLKQYRHLQQAPSNRPKREAAQKKAMVIQGDRSSLLHSGVSDDDGAPNTYDDNDSFLDDAIMGSDQDADKVKAASEDSDWSPGAEPVEVKGAKKAKVH